MTLCVLPALAMYVYMTRCKYEYACKHVFKQTHSLILVQVGVILILGFKQKVI